MGEGPIALILAPTRYDFLFLLVSLFLCVLFIFIFCVFLVSYIFFHEQLKKGIGCSDRGRSKKVRNVW